MSNWQNADITIKLVSANEHFAAKCKLPLNENIKHIKAANEHY